MALGSGAASERARCEPIPRRLYKIGFEWPTHALPRDTYPIDATVEKDHFRACPGGPARMPFARSPVKHKGDWSKLAKELPGSEQDLLANIEFNVIESSVVTMMCDEINDLKMTCKGASDGSVVGGSGTFGWALRLGDASNKTRGVKGNQLMSNKGRAYGTPMTSHRSEAYGMWSYILAIIRLCQCFEIAPHRLSHLVCDNEALVKKKIGRAHV